jgi:SHS2 domain-containing protein
MPYRFLDDAPPADVGFVASGPTLGECFRAATDATAAAMVANVDALERRERRAAHVENESLELALVKLLDEIVYYKDAEGLLLRAREVSVRQSGERSGKWIVEAALEGEPIDPERHELTGDVKAVTVHRLAVRHTDAGWEATVVLDV